MLRLRDDSSVKFHGVLSKSFLHDKTRPFRRGGIRLAKRLAQVGEWKTVNRGDSHILQNAFDQFPCSTLKKIVLDISCWPGVPSSRF
jgi:hypothetical protein